jgi:hypothetical protein
MGIGEEQMESEAGQAASCGEGLAQRSAVEGGPGWGWGQAKAGQETSRAGQGAQGAQRHRHGAARVGWWTEA